MTDIAAGATALGTQTPVELFAGDAPIVTDTITVANGSTLAKYQVYGIVTATGKAKPLDPAAVTGEQVAVGIAAQAIDATAADATGPAFVAGCFNHAALGWPAGATHDTLAERRAAFARTPIIIGQIL